MSELEKDIWRARSRIAELSPRVVGITGSVGKSVTARLLASAIRGSFRLHSVAVGIDSLQEGCAEIVSAPDGTEILLLELSASQRGEIGELVRIFPVFDAVVTDEKLPGTCFEIVESSSIERLFYNKDDEGLANAVAAMGGGGRIKKIGVGSSDADVKISDVRQSVATGGEPELSAVLAHNSEKYWCRAGIIGRQNARNMALAFSVALEFGVHPDDIRSRMAEAQLPSGRGRIYRTGGGGFLIDESCGATPDSVSYSLKNIIELETRGGFPKFAILGGMRELGSKSLYWHEVVMSRASLLDGVYLIGSEWDGVVTEQTSLKGRWADADEFMCDFDPRSLDASVTLLKGSGFYDMGKILALLSRPLEAKECR
jgi:UDP-N-acetylmuramoyl-tripeptide--D-alanyl-D-alanine ligase